MDFTPSRRTQAAAAQAHTPRPRYEKLRPVKQRHMPRFLVKLSLMFAFLIVIVAVTQYAFTHLQKQAINRTTTTTTEPSEAGKVTQENPSFTALTPAGKNVAWTHLAPPNSADFYAFTDKLEGVSIRVSEQPLPDSFTNNPSGSLTQLARDYNANRNISVNGLTLYIGTSTKGQQSLLLTTDSLLILITSDATLNDKQWTDYITALQ